MRPGVTVLAIPGAWYITTELTGPAERGSQPDGIWTGLAGADLGLHPGTPVDPADLTGSAEAAFSPASAGLGPASPVVSGDAGGWFGRLRWPESGVH